MDSWNDSSTDVETCVERACVCVLPKECQKKQWMCHDHNRSHYLAYRRVYTAERGTAVILYKVLKTSEVVFSLDKIG